MAIPSLRYPIMSKLLTVQCTRTSLHGQGTSYNRVLLVAGYEMRAKKQELESSGDGESSAMKR